MISFACGLPGKAGLVLIPYSYSVKLFLNSITRNSPHPSYVIYTGQRYLTSHVVSTNFEIIISFLSLYFIISNHTMNGPIIVTDFSISGSFPLHRILYVPIRSTHSLSHGVSSSTLVGSLPF